MAFPIKPRLRTGSNFLLTIKAKKQLLNTHSAEVLSAAALKNYLNPPHHGNPWLWHP